MAKFEFDLGPIQDVIKELGNIDGVAPRMLKATGPIVKNALRKRVSKHRITGKMIESIKPEKPKKGKYGGWYLRVIFDGYDEDGVPNDLKANVIEYGSSTQQPDPFLSATVRDCEDEVVAVMQEEYDKWLREKGIAE